MHVREVVGRRLDAVLAPHDHRHRADLALGDPADVVLVVPGRDPRRLAQVAVDPAAGTRSCRGLQVAVEPVEGARPGVVGRGRRGSSGARRRRTRAPRPRTGRSRSGPGAATSAVRSASTSSTGIEPSSSPNRPSHGVAQRRALADERRELREPGRDDPAAVEADRGTERPARRGEERDPAAEAEPDDADRRRRRGRASRGGRTSRRGPSGSRRRSARRRAGSPG